MMKRRNDIIQLATMIRVLDNDNAEAAFKPELRGETIGTVAMDVTPVIDEDCAEGC